MHAAVRLAPSGEGASVTRDFGKHASPGVLVLVLGVGFGPGSKRGQPIRPIGLCPELGFCSRGIPGGSGLWFWVVGFCLGFLWSLVWVGREHTGPIPADAGGVVGPAGPFPGSVGMGNF